MEEAVAACNAGLSIRKASKQFGVKRSTLYDRLHGRSSRLGPAPLLAKKHEDLLVEYITSLANSGFGISRATCLALAAEIVRRETGRPCQKLTTMWRRRFKKRNPTVTTKRPTSLEESRARNANPAAISAFFDLLEATIEKHSIALGQLWNVDEKGFNPDPIPKRVVTARASRAQQQHKRSHDHITANICINACGNHLPPQLIYNRAQLTTRLVENGPPGAIYCTSKTGSMDRELFQSWFKDLFLTSTSREKTQLILMDNHSSHISVEILELARKSNVVFIALPSKTTHILQPLDKTVFSAMGAHHQSTSAAARLLKPSHSLALSDFLPIFADTFTKSVTPANIMAASFKVTGVYGLRTEGTEGTEGLFLSMSSHHMKFIALNQVCNHSAQKRKHCSRGA
ncbi:uncharacterized protein LOC135819081 [Sycon ciliatum]|uniref:uncharacterized protein LOC135819081 n=1 Tax=Sycon ciliatum TaxID=27933 RepID=UPI0031F67D5A